MPLTRRRPPPADAEATETSDHRPTAVRGADTRYERLLLPAGSVLAVLAVWELYGRLVGIDPLFFSYPSQIWEGFLELLRGPLLGDLRTSGLELALGLAAALVAIPLGMLVGSSQRLTYAFDPLINALYAMPIMVLTPLFVIWFGLGIASKVVVVALMAFFPLLINTTAGVKTVEPALIRAARSFGATRWNVYRDVIVPGTAPFLVSGMRLAIGRGIIGVVIAEFIAAVEGIGYRIREAASVFDTPRYLAGLMILMVVAMILNALLKKAEARLAPWQEASGISARAGAGG